MTESAGADNVNKENSMHRPQIAIRENVNNILGHIAVIVNILLVDMCLISLCYFSSIIVWLELAYSGCLPHFVGAFHVL